MSPLDDRAKDSSLIALVQLVLDGPTSRTGCEGVPPRAALSPAGQGRAPVWVGGMSAVVASTRDDGRRAQAVDRPDPLRRGRGVWGTGTARSRPAGLRREIWPRLAPPRRRRARRGGDHPAVHRSPPAAAPATRAHLGRPSADGVGCRWTAARPASSRSWRPHAGRRRAGRGLVTRALALAAFVALACLVFARPVARSATRRAAWYGYAAFALALPYPVLKTWWALGGSFGLRWPGADGLAGLLRPLAARRPLAFGGRPVPASGADATLAAAPAVCCSPAGLPPPSSPPSGRPPAGGSSPGSPTAISTPGAWRPGSLASSTAAGSCGASPPLPPPAPIRCVVRLATSSPT